MLRKILVVAGGIVFLLSSFKVIKAEDLKIKSSPAADELTGKPKIVLTAPDSETQYKWLLANLDWGDVTLLKSDSPAEDWKSTLAKNDVLLIEDSGLAGDVNRLVPVLKGFLESGGLLLAVSDYSARLVNSLGLNAGESRISPPDYPVDSSPVQVTRRDRRSPLMCDPHKVDGPMYSPPSVSEQRFGYSGVSSDWNKLAWNKYDQPVLMERRVGKGLFVMMAMPIAGTIKYDVTDWVPFLQNAWALLQAQRAGTARGSDIDRGRLQRLVSDTGAILADGKPFFPIFIGHVASGQVQWKEQSWFKALPPQFLPPAPEQQVRECAAAGFNVIGFTMHLVDLPVVSRLAGGLGLKLMPAPYGLDANTSASIRQYGNQPGLVFGWSIYDEPELYQVAETRPDQLKLRYEDIKRLDPTHPLFLNMNVAMFDDYAPAADVMGIDVYPIGWGLPSELGFRIEKLFRATGGQVPLVTYVQAYDISGKGAPSNAEYRFMLYDAITQGARGVAPYAYLERPGKADIDPVLSRTPLWKYVTELNKELSALSPLFLAHRIIGERMQEYVNLGTRGAWAHKVLFTDGKEWLLIIANSSSEQHEAAILVSNPLSELRLVSDGKDASSLLQFDKTSHAWNDTFDAWQVKVYRFTKKGDT